MEMEGAWQWYDIRSYVFMCLCECLCAWESAAVAIFFFSFFVTAALFSFSSIIYLNSRCWFGIEFLCVSATKEENNLI